MMFRVTVINLTEHTRDSWEYEDLLSALKVAKNVDTSTHDDLVAKPAMTDEFFANNLWGLLTHGFVYVRNDVMVFLWNVNESGIERPIFTAEQLLKGMGFTIPSPPEHSVISKDTLPGMRKYSPVGESNIVRGED